MRLLVDLQYLQRDAGETLKLRVVILRSQDSRARCSASDRCVAGIRIAFAVASGVCNVQGRRRRTRAHVVGKREERGGCRKIDRSLARSPLLPRRISMRRA